MSDTWDYRGPYDPDPVPTDWVWERLRNQRNLLLTQSDWTQLPDVELPTKQSWADYRQALRELPDVTNDPREAIWPTSPQ